ncbi:hypothetical protein MASR1M36_08410 [Candidatus Cloacimonadaceae bacterium]
MTLLPSLPPNSSPPATVTYNDMAIKQLCSLSTITTKIIYRSVFSFTPSHMLKIRSNHKPQFNVFDDGMLWRMALIPFGYKASTDERIERYDDTLLREKSGILNWVIEGW